MQNVKGAQENRYCFFEGKKATDIYLGSCGIYRASYTAKAYTGTSSEYQLHVVISGKGSAGVGDSIYEVREGHILILRPGEQIRYQGERKDPCSYSWISFGGRMAENYVRSAGFGSNNRILYYNRDVEEYPELVQRMLECRGESIGDELLRNGLMMEYLSRAIYSYERKRQISEGEGSNSADGYVKAACRYMEEYYPSVCIADVADYVGIHRTYLSGLFRKQLGISPQKYLLTLRLENSRRLLRETPIPIQEIANTVGYEDPLTFSRMFKSAYGMGPRDYRKNSCIQGEAL